MSFAFAILFFLPPYALAVAMPSWRWLLAYIAVVGGLLGVWFTAMATSQPRYGEEAIGFLFLLPIAVSFGAGTLIRTASLIMAACGRSRASVFATNLLGFSIPLGIFGATIGWLEWETRSPSEACSRATFHIELAGGRLAIPAAPIFSIQIGPDRKQGTYNFSIPAKLRDFCGLTDDGRRPIRAVRINIGFGVGARWSNPKFCSASPAAWETQLCSAIEAGKRDWTYEADFFMLLSSHLAS